MVNRRSWKCTERTYRNGSHRHLPAAHSAAATSALQLWMGFMVTQRPMSLASGTLQGLDSIFNRGTMTRSDVNLVQIFRGQKCGFSDTLQSPGAAINPSTNLHFVEHECYSESH